tara:strand:- start:543 stop:932 length:390 start_codon:yes stop_codon:yes gene_type:complete
MRATRNRRSRTVGQAPVPTPVFYGIVIGSITTTEITCNLIEILSNVLNVSTNQVNATGRKSNMVIQAGVNLLPVTTSIVDDGGTAQLIITYDTPLTVGGYSLILSGFDPSIRGAEGQWLAPIAIDFIVM